MRRIRRMDLPRNLRDQSFTWAQAAAQGVSRDRLTALVKTGDVRRVLHNVYQPAHVPDSIESRCQAAVLVMRPFAVLCDRTAAWLHGVDTLEYVELDMLPPLEMVVLRDNSRTRRRACRGGERDLAPEDISLIGRIRVTTPLRTALDLGCSMGARDALAALDGFMRVCGVTRSELQGQLPRFRGRRGVVQLRRLVPLATSLSESSGESWTRLTIIDAGLPAPLAQFWVVVDGVPRYRLDLAYPKLKVAVEYDGREYHDSPQRRRADERRRTWLRAHGWTIIVVRGDCFTREAAESWISELAEALRLAPSSAR